jgi:Poly A polymerase head domain
MHISINCLAWLFLLRHNNNIDNRLSKPKITFRPSLLTSLGVRVYLEITTNNTTMSADKQQTVLHDEPSLDDDGVIVPTEIYRLTAEESNVHDFDLDEASKILPQAFESLASSNTVRLGLDHDEEQLFDTILNTTLAYEHGEIKLDDEPDNKDYLPEPLQIRVAGGWVRDKLLGLQTHDVDITVDKMMGAPFATLIQKYLLSLPLSHPARCQSKYPKIGVIAANPAQSKHLETATMRVHNIDIDVCHLRSEEIYQENSRIPTVSIGTPFQDAQRR